MGPIRRLMPRPRVVSESKGRAPPRRPRLARAQQPGRRSSVISCGAFFCPRAARWSGAMASFNVEVAACSADPADFIDRAQPTKLEIPFGHAFYKHGLSLPKRAVRVRRLRSASRAAPTRAGRRRKTEGALRDHHYRVTTVEDAMRQSRSMPWAGTALAAPRVEQDDRPYSTL